MKIILASASPRRRELLEQINISFEVIKSNVEEIITKVLPGDIVMELSQQKAMDVADKLDEEALVIGSDTIVAVDNNILGKPKDRKEAYDMISLIQGRTHQVYTGVTIVKASANDESQVLISFADLTDVEVYPMTHEQINEYIDTPEPYDKAGAYGIQGIFGRHVKGIHGDYNTVVGLPAARLYNELVQNNLI